MKADKGHEGKVDDVTSLRSSQGNHMTYFQKQITEKGFVPAGVDARHLEGFIRLQYATLGHLDWRTIRREVRLGIACIKEGGVDAAERNARSFGL